VESSPEARRAQFEEEYLGWIRRVAANVSRRLARLPDGIQQELLRSYALLEDTGRLYRQSPHAERIHRLSNGKTRGHIILETDGVDIFPSLTSPNPGVLDFAIGMGRRFYFRGLWFSVLGFNAAYLEKASDKMLTFAIEQELEMIRIYAEISAEAKVSQRVEDRAERHLNIQPDELREDERILMEISDSQPLIPRPYSEIGMLVYIETKFQEIKSMGVPSRDEAEEGFGSGLFKEFLGWEPFTRKSYLIFVSEIRDKMRDAFSGYA